MAITLVLLMAAFPSLFAAPASSLSDEKLIGIKFDQKLDSPVSLSLSFSNEIGQPVRLGNYFDEKPVILVLGYYECPMLCTLVLNGLVAALQELKMDVGNQFEVVMVSIDPTETPELALAKKRTYLKRYGRAGAGEGWHFLTGDQAAIRRLADEVGFRFAYDPTIDQYAHPSGLIVLTPEGRVSQYLFGVNFSAKELNAALKEAASHRVGSPVEQLILLCFHYNPLRGKYGNVIMTVLRVGAVLTVLAIGTVMVVTSRRHRKRAAGETAEAKEAGP